MSVRDDLVRILAYVPTDFLDAMYPGDQPLDKIANELLIRFAKELADANQAEADKCPFIFAHTRHWCGYSTCREG